MPDLDVFEPLSKDQQPTAVARHLPIGRVWDRAFDPDANLYKLAAGLSLEFFRLELMVKILAGEIDIVQTVDLVREWEISVGIPDECLKIESDITLRRKNVLQKFSNLGGVQTAEDFERVAALYGYVVEVVPASPGNAFPMTFPFRFFESRKALKHTMIVITDEELSQASGFPYEFPFVFQEGLPTFIECIFNKLAPANVRVLFEVEPPIEPTYKIRLEENGARLLLEDGSLFLLEESH